MKLNADGTTVAFDSLQTFEIGMIEGCDAGSLLVEDELSPYFNNITQPIYFVADSNITENDTVLIRVGVIDNGGGGGSASRPVKINSKEKELLTLRKNKTPQQKPLGENTATYCFLGEIDWSNMGDGFVVVGNECDEEIVVCDNFEPQKFDVSSIERYQEGQIFHTYEYDNYGNEFQYYVKGCQIRESVIKKNKNAKNQGITIIVPGIPIGKEITQPPTKYYWLAVNKIRLKACLSSNSEKWKINIDNIRIPIFVSDCIQDLIDLRDGIDTTLLNNYIINGKEYRRLIQDLDKWIEGSYSNIGKYTYKYCFSSGLLKHEEYHYNIEATNIEYLFNNMFETLNDWELLKSEYICPEDVLTIKKPILELHFNNTLNAAIYRYTQLAFYEQNNEEYQCDQYASKTYKDIKKLIVAWAKDRF